jgi:hypothetical protein
MARTVADTALLLEVYTGRQGGAKKKERRQPSNIIQLHLHQRFQNPPRPSRGWTRRGWTPGSRRRRRVWCLATRSWRRAMCAGCGSACCWKGWRGECGLSVFGRSDQTIKPLALFPFRLWVGLRRPVWSAAKLSILAICTHIHRCEEDVRAATLAAAAKLKEAGAEVEEVSVPLHRDSACDGESGGLGQGPMMDDDDLRSIHTHIHGLKPTTQTRRGHLAAAGAGGRAPDADGGRRRVRFATSLCTYR